MGQPTGHPEVADEANNLYKVDGEIDNKVDAEINDKTPIKAIDTYKVGSEVAGDLVGKAEIKARAVRLIRDFGGKREGEIIMESGRSEGREGGRDTAPRTEGDDPTQPLYLPLIDGHIIRLLELQPGAGNDPVVMRLFLVELEHAPDYEALSYVWGDTKITLPVTCNGRPFDVTVNLNAALRRLRYTNQVRILWADAICINQGLTRERSHHVGFMNIIYRHAKKVLVCMGQDPDGGADDVVALLNEHNTRMLGYSSVLQMPVLAPDDPLLDDPRWKSLAVLMRRPWFTRAWVLQEVGVAKHPQVFYGDAEFSYRDLMKLIKWMRRCASNLEVRAGVFWLTIHTDWEYWLPDWRAHATEANYTLVDFLGHARGLSCKEPKDHIYAFLGHPLAQLEDGSGPIIKPDYEKDTRVVYQEMAAMLLQSSGLRTLSSVEHDSSTISEEFPSWVPRSNVELVQNSLGVWLGYYYHSSPDVQPEPPPFIIEGENLKLRGVIVDSVSQSYQFSTSSEDLERPNALRSLQAANHEPVSLDRAWEALQDSNTPCCYPGDKRLEAFSLTLCAGLTNFEPAEDNLGRHWANFAAYWGLRLQSTSTSALPSELRAEMGKGDSERFWTDMSLSSEGRSFFITQKGYYGLGPWIAEPGDICCILLGARVPFILRKTDKEFFYKLVGETYIHGFMRGEVGGKLAKGDLTQETVVIC